MATGVWFTDSLENKGYTGVEYLTDDEHAVYYTYDNGEIKIVLDNEDEEEYEVFAKDDDSSKWKYIGDVSYLPEDWL